MFKSKKIFRNNIVIICLITFLCLPFAQRINYGSGDVEAAFVIDDAVYLMILASVVGTGFYIANNEQGRKVVGDLIYENFTSYAEMEKELFEIREDIEGKTLTFKDLGSWTKEMLPSLAKYNGIIQDTSITMHNVEVGQDISTSEMGEGCIKTVNYDTPQNISFYCRYASGRVETTPVFKKVTRWWMETVWNGGSVCEYEVRLYYEKDGQIGFLFGNPVSMNSHYGIASIESNAVSQLEDKRVNTYDFTASKDSAITDIKDWALSPTTNISIPYDYSLEGTTLDFPSIGLTQEGTITGIPGITVTVDDVIVDNPSISDTDTNTGIISSILEGVKGITGILTDVLSAVVSLPVAIVDSITDVIVDLFVPSVSISDFIDTDGTFFGQLIDLFDYSSLSWEQRPFSYNYKYSQPLNDDTVEYDVDIGFDNELTRNYIGYIRNFFSYGFLIFVVYQIISHILPKRDID